MERSAAAIMAKFEEMWTVFVRGGGSFASFIDLYLQRWLHSSVIWNALARAIPHWLIAVVL